MGYARVCWCCSEIFCFAGPRFSAVGTFLPQAPGFYVGLCGFLWLFPRGTFVCFYVGHPIGGSQSPMGCAAPSLVAWAMHRLGLWVGRGGLAGGGCSPEAVQPRRHSVPGRAACVWWGLCGQCYRRLPSRARLCACRNWSRFRLRCWCVGGSVTSDQLTLVCAYRGDGGAAPRLRTCLPVCPR